MVESAVVVAPPKSPVVDTTTGPDPIIKPLPPRVIDAESRTIDPAKPKVKGRGLSGEFGAAFRGKQRAKRGGSFASSDEGRPSLGDRNVWLILTFEVVAVILARIFFGLPFPFVLQFALLGVVGLVVVGGPAPAMMLGNLALGLYAASYLFGFMLWPSSLVGGIAVLLLAFRFLSFASPTTGDVNPIAYITAIVALRTYLATFYATITGYSSVSNNYLNWITTFVVGAVPDWPVIANVVSIVVLNGTLLVYLVLLIKRIVNPLAN